MTPAKWAPMLVAALVLSATGVHADPDPDLLPPWGLTVETVDSGVRLSWNEPAGAVEAYNVYRADDMEAVTTQGMAAFSLIGQTTDTAFIDARSGSAIYVVTALHDGDESPPSNPAGYPYCLSVHPSCFLPLPLG